MSGYAVANPNYTATMSPKMADDGAKRRALSALRELFVEFEHGGNVKNP